MVSNVKSVGEFLVWSRFLWFVDLIQRTPRLCVCVLCVLCVCSVCLASRPALTTNWGVPYRDRISIHVILWKKSKFHLSYYQQIKLCWIIKAQIAFRCGTSHHCWLFSLLLAIHFWVIFAWSLRCRTGCVLTSVVLLWTFSVYKRHWMLNVSFFLISDIFMWNHYLPVLVLIRQLIPVLVCSA